MVELTKNPKYDTYKRSTQESSYPQIQNLVGGGGSGSYEIVTASGETVKVESQPVSSYPNVVAERKKSIEEANALTEKQKKELEAVQIQRFENLPKKADKPSSYQKVNEEVQRTREEWNRTHPVTVAVNYSQVDQFNKSFAEAGIMNAKDFLEKAKSGELKKDSQGNYQYTYTVEEKSPFIIEKKEEVQTRPVRTVLDSETSPVPIDYSFADKYFPKEKQSGGVFSADDKTARGQMKVEEALLYSLAESKQREKYLPQPINLLSIGATDFSQGVIQGGVIPAIRLVKNPVSFAVETAQGFGYVVTHPVETGIGIVKQTVTEPFVTAGEVFTMFAGGKILTKFSPVKVSVVYDENIPIAKEVQGSGFQSIGVNKAGKPIIQGTGNPVQKVPMKIGYEITYPTLSKELNLFYETKPFVKWETVESGVKVGTKLEKTTVEASFPSQVVQGETFIPTRQYRDFLGTSQGKAYSVMKEDLKLVDYVPEIELSPSLPFDIMMEQSGFKFDVKTGLYSKGGKEGSNFMVDRFTGEVSDLSDVGGKTGSGGGMQSFVNAELEEMNPFDKLGSLAKDGSSSLGSLVGKKKRYFMTEQGQVLEEATASPTIKIQLFSDKTVRQQANPPITSLNFNAVGQTTSLSQATFSKTTTFSGTASSQVTKTKTIQGNIQIQNLTQSQGSRLSVTQAQAQSQSQSQSQAQIQSQTQSQVQVQSQAQKQLTVSLTGQKVILKTKIVKTKPFLFNNTNNGRGVYSVEVKSKGKFKNIGVFGSVAEAFEKGRKRVQNTASASFRIRNDEGFIPANSFNLGSSFTVSRRSPDIIVQKRSDRIGSQGEKEEITYKGVFANRKNKKGRSVFL